VTGFCAHGVRLDLECTACITTPQGVQVTKTDDTRQAYIDGLHQIADFLAEHPAVPLPTLGDYVSGGYRPTLAIFLRGDEQRDLRTKLADVARAMGRAEKSTHHEFAIWRRFSGMVLAAYAPRNEVCERVVTGTREVTREVPDPEALAAVPKVVVTETVEDVTWECIPLLKSAPKGLISL